MRKTLIELWHKLRAALTHIEEELGFVPDEQTGVHPDSGDNGPKPPPPPPGK